MNRLRTSIFFVFVSAFLFPSLNLNAQQKIISGIVADDSSSVPLYGASVSLLNEQGLAIHYTFTNQTGNFKLAFSNKSVWVNISYVGYKTQQVKLDTSKTFYDIRLKAEAVILKDVTVKNRPAAKMKGDTLSYLIRDFANKNDRSIADVIRNLPGIEVTDNGSIYFNGKKIENLYIEGDDVMDGRYGMATKVIKKELIKSVDIISHHQPIKVLKDKVFTDNVVLNLVLQNENSLKLSATSQLGVGLPAQIEASIAPIVLSKKLKIVSLAGYNNAGIDYKNEIKQLGGSNFVDDISAQKKDITLSLSSISAPDIPLSYYYFNKSAIFSLNTLYKTKSDVQLKWNSNLFFDRNHLDYEGETLNYLADDTITYSDRQTIINKPLLFSAGFNVMINKAKCFLTNSFRVLLNKNISSGLIDFNGNSFEQILNQKDKQFSNDFDWIPSIKNKGIAELRWYSSYGTNWQRLNIDSSYYFDVSPQSGYYDMVTQQTQSPAWFHNVYLSYKFPSEKIFQEYRFGYKYLQEDLNSNLSLIDNGVIIPYANDSGNDATFTNSSIYLLSHYQIKRQKFRSDIQLPFLLQQIKSKQPLYSLNEHKSNLLVLPNLNFTYNFDDEKYLQATYQLQNIFGDITTAYKGVILLNYRNLQAYTQGFQQQKIHRANVMYSHQKSIKLFYSNIGLSYDYTMANTILSDSLSNNISHAVFIPYDNSQKTVSVYGGLSQYLFTLKTKVGLKMQKQWIFSEQFVNNILLPFQLNNFTLGASADKNVAKIININYNANLSWLSMKLTDKTTLQFPQTKSFSFDQKFKVSLNFLKHFYIETTGTHRINKWQAFNNTGYFFLDASVKRLGILKGLDAELNCYNLLNVKDYTIYQQSKNQFSASSYPTRGITFFLRVNYSF
ncbi:MAG: carboxypeptidase-like regulatory domain-containing protein [Chitinophagaceae bacterium]|nr:carboxypeptidase-like regulatory domain-containing protein [Chitinophagaceae bacterium]